MIYFPEAIKRLFDAFTTIKHIFKTFGISFFEDY